MRIFSVLGGSVWDVESVNRCTGVGIYLTQREGQAGRQRRALIKKAFRQQLSIPIQMSRKYKTGRFKPEATICTCNSHLVRATSPSVPQWAWSAKLVESKDTREAPSCDASIPFCPINGSSDPVVVFGKKGHEKKKASFGVSTWRVWGSGVDCLNGLFNLEFRERPFV